MNLFIINIHAPTEFRANMEKDFFHKETKIVLNQKIRIFILK